MEWSDIIVPMLSGLFSLLVCLVNGRYQANKTTALVTYRLEQLEKKVDKHNNLIERMYDVEKETARQTDELHRHNARFSEIEEKLSRMEGDLK